MLEFIFTVDYEIYGNGEGSLKELVYWPAERLRSVFLSHNSRFVIFAEAVQLEMIEAFGSDADIDQCKNQLRQMYSSGFELGLHIHAWWHSAKYVNGKWELDYDSYNLCALPDEQIQGIVDRSIKYYRKILSIADFTPISFRAGHLIFQPTNPLGRILTRQGVKLDSSFYKGGRWRLHSVDYRRSPRNLPFWRFTDDVTQSKPDGNLLEMPIYSRMTPIWKLLTSKRIGLQRAGLPAKPAHKKIVNRIRDMARLYYPLKFDVGQMTRTETNRMLERILRDDRRQPSSFRPIVVIMHTKDPIDYDGLDLLLGRLDELGITVSTFSSVYSRIQGLLGNSAGRLQNED